MRWPLALIILAASACTTLAPPPAPVAVKVAAVIPAPIVPPRPAVFNAAAPYVTAGQDEPGYQAWLLAVPGRDGQVAAFNQFLDQRGVGGIVPTWQLLRTASMWRKCGAEAFEVAPQDQWGNLVQTLQYVRDHVVPVVGPVEPVSVYRNPTLNQCAGGAADSAHRHVFAIDMVPLRPITRDALMRGLCAIHSWQGNGHDVGLGFYIGLRFHIDSRSFRKWGAALGDENSIGCPQVMADIAARAAASKAASEAAAPEAPKPEPVTPADPLAPKN